MHSAHFLISGLIFFACPVMAQWVKYEQSTTSGFVAFYNPLSIKAEGDLRSVQIMKNYHEPKLFDAERPHFKYSSTISTQLINCNDNSYKNLRIQIWSLRAGKGEQKKNYDYSNKDNWDIVKQGSIQEALHQKICLAI